MKCIKLNFCLFIRTLDKGMVGAFYCNKGFFLCTSGADYRQNTLFFPNLIINIPNWKINLRSYQYSRTSMARTPLGL